MLFVLHGLVQVECPSTEARLPMLVSVLGCSAPNAFRIFLKWNARISSSSSSSRRQQESKEITHDSDRTVTPIINRR